MFHYFENLIDPFRPAPAGVPPRRVAAFYWHYIAQVWPAFAVLLLLGLLGALTEVALFGFLGRIVDLLQTTHPAALFAEHGHSLVWMAMVALLARPMAFLAHDLLLNQTIKPSLSSLIRWQNHRHVLRQSLGFFHGDFAGRIANRVMSTGASLRESASQVVDALWYVMVYVGSALWLFADANLWLMLPLLAWVALYLALMRRYVPRLAQRSQATSDARSRLMGRIVDGYSNILTLKLFARTEGEEDYVRDALDEQTQKHRQMGRVITLMDFYMTVLNGLLIVVTTALALWLWSLGTVSAGDVALSSGLVIRIVNMSGWILWTVSGIFEDIGTVQDGIDTISRPLELVDAPAAPALQVSRGQLQFDAVRFAYPKSAPIFNDFSLQVAAGEKIGLIGPSGAGKSTLVALLLRLYDPDAGRILIDGQDIAKVTQDSLRAQIGVVTQDTALLHRSIRENLRYGRPDADDLALLAAARDARADGFIPQLQDGESRSGLDAHVGERGVKLSGGQRQRIAIARVLLKDAPLLILDEATSALDSEVEVAIQDSLDRLMQGKTVIAIAHRLSTIARMDRLVVLDQGRIVETGSHRQLIEQGGLYARLWAHQSGGFVGA